MVWQAVKPGEIRVELSADFYKLKKQIDWKNFKPVWDKLKTESLDKMAEFFEGEVRKKIVQGKIEERNAPLTQVLKKGGIPLVHGGQLQRTLTHSVFKNTAKVGWPKGLPKYPRSKMTPGKLAKEIHGLGGRVFTVTPAMRKFFRYLAWKTQGEVRIPKKDKIYVPRRAPLTDSIAFPKTRKATEKKFRQVMRAGLDKHFK